MARKKSVRRNISSSKRNRGFGAMPLGLKLVFIILIIGLISSLSNLFSPNDNGYSFLGMYLVGYTGMSLMFIFNVLLAALLVGAMYQRERWAGLYGLYYCIFFVVNGLLGFFNLGKLVQVAYSGIPASDLLKMGSDAAMMSLSWIVSIILIVGIIINLLLAWIFYKSRKYFR